MASNTGAQHSTMAAPAASDAGYHVESKGAPASAQTSYEPSATAKAHAGGPSAAMSGVTAAGAASAIPSAHVSAGNTDAGAFQQAKGPSTPMVSSEAQNYTKEAERIVEEERAASEKLPHYPGLDERFQLICKMGE